MKRALVAGMLVMCAAAAQAQEICGATCNVVVAGVGTVNGGEIKPQAVPTSNTAVVSYDVHLLSLTITNTTGGALTVTVTDQQVSPVALLGAVSIAANTTYVIAFPGTGYYCPGGVKIQASGSGLNFFARWN